MKIKFIDSLENFTGSEKRILNNKNLLLKQCPQVKNVLLSKLLEGKTINSSNIYRLLDFLDIKFPYQYFCVMIVSIDVLKGQNNRQNTILDIINDILKKDVVFYAIQLDLNKVAILMNLSEKNSEEYSKNTYKIADKIQSGINNKLLCAASIGVGNTYNGLNRISESYEEAIYCIDYRLLDRNSIAIFDQSNIEYGHYYYPLNVEKKLINFVKTGKDKEACDLLRKVFEENFKVHNLPVKVTKCLFFDIMGTVMKIILEINADYSQVRCDELIEKYVISECGTVNGMYNAINDMIIDICSYVNRNKRSHNLVLLGNIYEYLNENYTDGNISVSTIAQNVGITPNYLSQFFKEQTGESVMVYVNRMRIKKAKEILKYSRENLETIANAVGYTNNAILIRAFKKQEGITPGEYRLTCS